MLRLDVNPSTVIYALNEAISKKYPFIKSKVFTPGMDYVDSIIAGRNIDLMNFKRNGVRDLDSKAGLLPMLSWDRSVLRKAEGLGRPGLARARCELDVATQTFSHFAGKIDYNFQIFTTNMNDAERFELDWYVGKGLRNIDKVVINLGEKFGQFTYGIVWEQELQSLDWSLEGNYYKSIGGTSSIQGSFLSLNVDHDSKGKSEGVIKNISMQILDCNGNPVLDDIIIPSEEDLLKIGSAQK